MEGVLFGRISVCVTLGCHHKKSFTVGGLRQLGEGRTQPSLLAGAMDFLVLGRSPILSTSNLKSLPGGLAFRCSHIVGGESFNRRSPAWGCRSEGRAFAQRADMGLLFTIRNLSPHKPGMVVQTCNPGTGRWRREDQNVKVIWS